jgi:hypothetical protein|nr:MAG TPA: hypothetical protein [Caudoviricetes sp.]
MPFFNLNELSEKERKKYLQDLDNTAYNNSLQVREEEQKILNENINLPTREDFEKQSGANNSIFQSGAFSDGYQFGDIFKSIGATALSTFNNMVKGVAKLGEGISDWTSNRIADIVEATGDKDNANRIRKNVLQNDTDNNIVTKTIKDVTDKDTLLGEKGQNFVQQLSRTGFQAAIGAGVGVLGTAAATAATAGTTFISSSGSGEVEALNEQYNKAIKDGYNPGIEEYLNSEEGKKARGKSAIYGHLVGAIEAGTEAMFAGLGKATTAIGYGKSGLGLDDKIAKSLSNRVSSTLAKNLIQYGVKAGGESVEELVGGIGQAIAQKLTYKQDEGLGQLIKDQNIPEAMLSAFVSSAIMQAPGMYSTTKNGQDFMTGLNKTDTETYEQLIETEQKDLIKKKAIENEYNNQIKENDYNDIQKQELLEQITKDYDEGKLLSPKLTTKEIEQSEDNARNMLEEIKRVESENKNTANNSIEENSNNDSEYEKYQFAKSNNDKVNELRQSIVENTDWNNSKDTQNYVKMLEKIVEDKNIDIRVEDLGTTEDGKMINGKYEDGVITINPNSNRAGEFIAVHELTHAIGNEDMLKMIETYRKSNPEFDNAVQKLIGTYNESQINQEALADISGQLFGSQEFINHIQKDNPGFFKRIYNEIKYLWHQFRGYTNQNQFIEDLYNKWTDAYNNSNSLNQNTSLLLSDNAYDDVKEVISLNQKNSQNYREQYVQLKDKTIKTLVDYGVKDEKMMARVNHVRENILTAEEAKDLGYSIKNKEFHGLGLENYLKIIDSMDNPIGVYQYVDGSGSKYDSNNFIVVTPVELNGQKCIVPVKINEKGSYNKVEVDFNRIKTAFDKKNNDNYIDHLLKTGQIKEILPGSNSQKESLSNKNIQQNDHNVNSQNSINSENWKEYLENNFKSDEITTNMRDLNIKEKKILPNKEDFNNKEKINLPIKKDIKQNETEKETINLPTPGEEIDYSQMERPTDNKKNRQFYRSVIESSNTTAEAKAVAKQLMKSDTYIPDSNLKQLQRADMNIEANGVDNSLETLKGKLGNGDRITATDIATSERLIEYYSKVGDKAKLQDAIQTSAMAGTEAGRTVQALSILNHSTPEGQVVWIQRSIDKLNDKLEKTKVKERFKFTPEMQQEILQATNQEEALNNVYKQLGQQVPMTTMQKLDSWRYFAMLGNPRTHIRNIVGNKVMGYIQQAKNQLAGTIEDIVLRNSDDRQFTTRIADKKTKDFAKADINNVLDRLGLTENKYNPKSRIEQNQKVFKSEFMNKTIGKLMEFNDMALEAEDGWGLKAMYPKALAQYITANNIDVDNITDAQLAKARNFAIRQAEEATFHQDNAIASAISQFEGKNALTRFAAGAILPFKKTPMNVAVEGIQYSPVGLLDSLTRGSINLRKGKINVHEYIDGISKGLTGTGIALLGYALTEAGILKASGGDDQDKNNFESAQGKQNYSLKVGEKTYSLDWLAPTGIPLFMGSELYQLASQKVKEKGEKNNTPEVAKSATKILNSMATAMNPLSEMSMISGLTSTLQSYASGNKGLENLGLNATKSYVGQFVPTVLGQVAKTFDDKERSTTSTESDPLPKALDTLGNQIKSKIPGLRQTLPTKTDIWGKDVENEGNIIEKGLNAGVFPWSSKKVSENNPTNKEISKLYDETLDKSVLPSNSIDKVLNIDKEKYRLSNEQYSKLKKMYGEINYKVLSELTSSQEYKEMNNEQKVKAISDIYKYSKAQIKSQYAQENDIDTEDSSILKSVKSIIYNGGKVDDYFKYVGMTTNAETTKEKADILGKSKLSDKTKEILYSSTIGKEDGIYNSLKDAININSYLNYKAQKIENKKELEEYLINSDMKSEEKVLLYATKYKVGEDDREYLYNYIKDLDIDTEQKTNIYRKIKGFKVVNDTIYY